MGSNPRSFDHYANVNQASSFCMKLAGDIGHAHCLELKQFWVSGAGCWEWGWRCCFSAKGLGLRVDFRGKEGLAVQLRG